MNQCLFGLNGVITNQMQMILDEVLNMPEIFPPWNYPSLSLGFNKLISCLWTLQRTNNLHGEIPHTAMHIQICATFWSSSKQIAVTLMDAQHNQANNCINIDKSEDKATYKTQAMNTMNPNSRPPASPHLFSSQSPLQRVESFYL